MAIKAVCKRTYHSLPNAKVSQFGQNVHDEYYTHPLLFPTPVIPIGILASEIVDFTAALNAWENGGIAQKAAYVSTKAALMLSLDTIADDVDIKANGVTGTITDGGFKFTKTSRTKVLPPPAPGTFTVKTVKGGGKIQGDVPKLNDYGTIYNIMICVEGAALNPAAITMANGMIDIDPTASTSRIRVNTTTGRKKLFTGLTPNTTYYFYFYYQNSKGCSVLSKPMMLIADAN